jgi:hypothetical protein
MKIYKQGEHRLFEQDAETSKIVDDWNPDNFELSSEDIGRTINSLDKQVIDDTDICQQNVRNFAREQLKTFLPFEIETYPGIILGHKHIPRKYSRKLCAGRTVSDVRQYHSNKSSGCPKYLRIHIAGDRQCQIECMITYGLTARARVKKYSNDRKI